MRTWSAERTDYLALRQSSRTAAGGEADGDFDCTVGIDKCSFNHARSFVANLIPRNFAAA